MMRASRSFLGLPLLVTLALLVLLIFELRPILTPFVVGGLLAYLGDPIADWLQRRGLGRSAAVALVFLVLTSAIIVVLLILVPLLINQLNILIKGIPSAYQWVTGTVLPWLREALDLPPEAVPALEVRQTLSEHWRSVGRLLAFIGRHVTSSSANLLVSLGNLVLIPVVAFYLMRDWDKLTPKAVGLLPEDWQDKAGELASECDEVIGAFLRGQFIVMLALGAIYSVGLVMLGLDVAVLVGTLAGLASIVPYLGAIVGIGAAAIAAWLQFGELSALVGVAAVFTVGQLIESYLLTPTLVGDRIGLHPVVVIFAILAGGQLAGFVGVLVALPVAAVIAVLLRHIKDYYKSTDFYMSEDRDAG